MQIVKNILLVLLLTSTAALAAPASESSIKELLVITESQKLVEGIQNQVSSMMDQSIKQSLQGKAPTPKQLLAIKNMKNKILILLKDELDWEKLEPMYIHIYEETFSEEEIVGIVSFYKTPVGQAMITKMPILTQKSMLEMQKMTNNMLPKMQKIQQEFVSEIKATN